MSRGKAIQYGHITMSKVYVVWQSYLPKTPNRGYWDDQLLENIFSRQMWAPIQGNEFEHVNSIQDVPRSEDGCIMILPARHHAHEMWIDKIHDDLSRFKWSIFMAIGDEESSFPAWRLKLKNSKLWLMMPRDLKDQHVKVTTRLPNGYPTDMEIYRGKNKKEELEKPLDWFFAGQDTHPRRHVFIEYAQAIQDEKSVLVPTPGFTQGLPHDEYYKLMASAKVIPCPCGAQAPDSFRVYEALESGCIPMVDNRSTNLEYPPGYWTYLFRGETPLPIVDDWRSFPAQVTEVLKDWRHTANKIGAWWQGYKRQLTYQLESDINILSGRTPGVSSANDKITAIISSSPIPSHPSPRIIKETIASVRAHLPTCEIIIMQDGVRPEQEHMRDAYEKYKQEVLFMCRNEWRNVLPVFYDEFLHQAEMTRRTLDQIKTPLLLFLEHDTPLVDEARIEWDGIVKAIESGYTESVRFHHHDTEFIHPEHMDFMIDKCRQEICGIDLVRTRQYSQRPHVATVDLYRKILSNFSDNCRTFIEDKAYELFYEGKVPYRLAIYAPAGHIKRSRDLNGREGEPKFDDRLVF